MPKTTHTLALELLALPDVPILIEGWICHAGTEIVAKMTNYDPTGTAILVERAKSNTEQH